MHHGLNLGDWFGDNRSRLGRRFWGDWLLSRFGHNGFDLRNRARLNCGDHDRAAGGLNLNRLAAESDHIATDLKTRRERALARGLAGGEAWHRRKGN